MFKKQYDTNLQKMRYKLHKRVVLKELPFFKKVCMNFFFKHGIRGDHDSLVFAKFDCLFELNFMTESIDVIYKFETPFLNQPQSFVPNSKHEIFFISCQDDGRLINPGERIEYGIHEYLDLTGFKKAVYDEKE